MQERDETLEVKVKEPALSTIAKHPTVRALSDIRFVRHRMLYARPFVSSQGRICLGLNQKHILSLCQRLECDAQTITMMKYIFPRQFGLHNVFTSDVDRYDTAQPFKDYSTREVELARERLQWKQKCMNSGKWSTEKVQALPKRLRGRVFRLVQRLRKRHARCSYHALLQHHCPAPVGAIDAEIKTFSFASSPAQVAAFCRSAIFKVLPPEFMGRDDVGVLNKSVVSRNIDKFIQLRRYESLSMHDVMQNMAVSDVEWLSPTKGDASRRISNTDFKKRNELMAELLYYIFDSLVIPLIRSNFHVTESSMHRNQLFYFRHDIWQAISRPALVSLKHNMLEECKSAEVKKLLSKRVLGVSKVRLLPKEQGMRPIINLRRRVQQMQQGKLVLGRSINSLLNPAFAILNYEKDSHPEMLGSALFSVDDMFPRLQAFKRKLQAQSCQGAPLYFAKVDVQACFDTIPQKRLMGLVRTIIANEEYSIARYARAKLLGGTSEATPGFGSKPSWRYLIKATADGEPFDFLREIESDTAQGRNRAIYVDNVVRRSESRSDILKLLEEHVESNLIQVGKDYYRQKEGIPQGSIVSSLLCSYIYAELEREVLSFLDCDQSMLLRLIDDFLVITTDRQAAERFMRIMHGGLPQYGVEIKAEKSRANFDVSINEQKITRTGDQCDFPYCGNAINTTTLDISKDAERRRRGNLADSMTVEYSRLPGQSFYRKTLSALKLQMHPMLLSTTYNGTPTVLRNLHHAFLEVATKSYYYLRSLAGVKRPGDSLIIKTVDDLIRLACVLMKHRTRPGGEDAQYACTVTSAQARWLAITAFHTVFARRQTRHGLLLDWLRKQSDVPALRAQRSLLTPIIDKYSAH
nr:isoform 2 of telomerase reverse transcriptase [Quercus suber]